MTTVSDGSQMMHTLLTVMAVLTDPHMSVEIQFTCVPRALGSGFAAHLHVVHITWSDTFSI